MGSYLNPTCKNFMDSLRSEIYVDKSGLIAKTNAVIDTQQKYICVSRPRRFGKSMAADMLAAYYSRGEDTGQLLHSLWNMDEEAVAAGIDRVHDEVSILQYNDENALSYTINLAFYFAKEYYTIIREFPSGKGFADICMIPRKLHADKPAIMIELKWDASADGAIKQIKERRYSDALMEYRGNLLLVGINYSQKQKKHQCKIVKISL